MTNFVVCRLCLLKLADGTSMEQNIFCSSTKFSIADQISKVTQLTLYEGDGFPRTVCQQCLFQLNMADSFIQQCILSYQNMQKNLLLLGDLGHPHCLKKKHPQQTAPMETAPPPFPSNDSLAVSGNVELECVQRQGIGIVDIITQNSDGFVPDNDSNTLNEDSTENELFHQESMQANFSVNLDLEDNSTMKTDDFRELMADFNIVDFDDILLGVDLLQDVDMNLTSWCQPHTVDVEKTTTATTQASSKYSNAVDSIEHAILSSMECVRENGKSDRKPEGQHLLVDTSIQMENRRECNSNFNCRTLANTEMTQELDLEPAIRHGENQSQPADVKGTSTKESSECCSRRQSGNGKVLENKFQTKSKDLPLKQNPFVRLTTQLPAIFTNKVTEINEKPKSASDIKPSLYIIEQPNIPEQLEVSKNKKSKLHSVRCRSKSKSPTKNKLMGHMEVCNSQRSRVLCDVCGSTFISKYTLKAHKNSRACEHQLKRLLMRVLD